MRNMRLKILIPAILALIAVSTIMTVTVLAGSTGNPGGTKSLHPDHSSTTHDANRIVHVPCGVGGHSRHVGESGEVRYHNHHLTYYWYDSNEDETPKPATRLIELRCGLAHSNATSFTSKGSYGTVGWNSTTGRFTFQVNTGTAKGKYTGDRVSYCNRLIAAGNNAGAYSPFEGVPDICDDYFFKADQTRPAEGGV